AAMWAQEFGAGIVQGIADLKDRYVRRLLTPTANGDEQLVDCLRQDAAAIAERELVDRFVPGQITRGTAVEVLQQRDRDAPEPNRLSVGRRLELLLLSRLVEAPSASADLVRVAPDPIAEHLVASLYARELGANTEAWHRFLDRVE